MNSTGPVYCGPSLVDFQRAYSRAHGYLSLLVCQFGSVANVLNVCVLSRREMRSPTNAILTALAVADLLVMLDYVPYAWHAHLSADARADRDRFSYGWTAFVLFHSLFTQLCHTVSICLTVLLAVWRYVAVAHPHRSRRWCSMPRTLVALALAYTLGPLVCLPLFLAVSVRTRAEPLDAAGQRIKQAAPANTTADLISANVTANLITANLTTANLTTANLTTANLTTANLTDLYYVQFDSSKLNFWIYGVVIKLTPCLALSVLSARLIVALLDAKRRRQRLADAALPTRTVGATAARRHDKRLRLLDKERQTDRTTRMLLAVLLLFLLTEFPQGILGLLSALLGERFFQQCYLPLGDLMDILALLNSAINFILYCSMSRQFRTTFKAVFQPRMLTRWMAVAQGPNDPNGHSTQVTQLTKNFNPSEDKATSTAF